MVEIGKTFDGTIEGAISATSKLNGVWAPLQKFMTLGDFGSGVSKKVNGTNLENNVNGTNIQNYASQIANLDEKQQKAIISATKFADGAKNIDEKILELTTDVSEYNRINSRTFESALTNWEGGDKILNTDVLDLMAAGGMKNGDNYALPETDKAVDALEKYINNIADADEQNRLFNAGITEMSSGTYVLTQKFKQLAGIEEAEGVVKEALITKQTALNAVMQIGKQLLFSVIASGAVYFAQQLWKSQTQIDDAIEQTATDSKEHSKSLTETSTSFSQIISQYEKLGDKTFRTAEETEQLKSLQEQVTELLKDQPDIGESMLKQVNLQNASYSTQLQLLKDIEEQQRKNAIKASEDNVDDQGDLLVEAYKKKMWNKKQIKDYDVASQLEKDGLGTVNLENGNFNFDVDSNDPDSIVNFYNRLDDQINTSGKEFNADQLKWVKDIKKALKDYVEAYDDAVDELHDNKLPEVAENVLQQLETQKGRLNPSDDKKAPNFDADIRKMQKYQDAANKLRETSENYIDKGFNKYGNVNNLNRGRIDQTEENKSKYADFAKEHPEEVAGEYSTVLGSSKNEHGLEVAYTPMLQTNDGLVPLTSAQIDEYLNKVFEASYDENDKLDLDKLMKVDATGFEQNINGEIVRVKGMIAGVEGGKGSDGSILSKADIQAIAGASNDEIAQSLFGGNAGQYSGMGWLSKYIGNSMHDVQAAVSDAKKEVSDVYAELQDEAQAAYEKTSAYCDNAAKDQTSDYERIKDAVDTLSAGISNFDTTNLTTILNTDGEGLGHIDTEALEKLKEIMTSLGFDPTISDDVSTFVNILKELGVVEPSVTEKNAQLSQSFTDAKTQMSNASQSVDDMQKAYQACQTAVDEYNKTKYVSVDTLQTLMNLDPQYLSMLQNENGQLEINTETAKNLTAATIQTQRAALLANAVTQIQQTNTLAAAKKVLGQAAAVIEDASIVLNEAMFDSAEYALENEGFEAMFAVLDASHQIMNNYEMMDKLWVDLSKQDPSKIWGKTSNSAKSSSKAASSALDAWSTLSSAMEEYNKQSSITYDTMKSLMGLEEKYTACLKKQGNELTVDATKFRNMIETELKALTATKDSSEKTTSTIAQYNQILQYLDQNARSGSISLNELRDAIEGVGTSLDKAQEKTSGLKSAFGTIHEILNTDNLTGALTSDNVENVVDLIQEHSELKDILFDESGNLQINKDSLKAVTIQLLENEKAATKDVAIQAVLQKSIDDLSSGTISLTDYLAGLNSELDEINSKMDNSQSAFNDLSDIVDEYNTYGQLSQDNIQKFMELDPKYTACLEMQGDKLIFNKEAFRALYVEELKELALKYEGTELGNRYAEILRKVADGTQDVTDHMQGMGTEAEKLKSIVSDLKDVFSSLLSVFETFNSNKDNDLKIWGEAMTEHIDDQIEALNKQKEALEDANDEEERAITLAKLKAELEKARTQRTVRKYTSNGYEWVADESAVKEAQDNLNDQQREWRKEDAEKAIDDQIDKLNELKDKYSEIINLIGTSWDDYNKKLKYSAEIADMTFTEMEGRLDSFKGNVLGAMQSTNATSGIQNVISKLESLITTLEKVNNIYGWIESGFTDYTDKGFNGLVKTVKKLFGTSGSDGQIHIDIGAGLKKLGTTVKNAFNGVTGDGGITGVFQKGQEVISAGAKSLFSSDGGNSLVTIFTNGLSGIGDLISSAFKGFDKLFSSGGQGLIKTAGNIVSSIGGLLGIGGVSLSAVPTMTAANTAGLTGLAGVVANSGIAAGALGTGTAVAGGAALSGIPVVGAIVAGVSLGVNSAIKRFQGYKDIWSSDDSTGTKVVKSIGNFLWHTSPFGIIVDAIETVGGWVKKIFGIEDKKNKNNGGTSSANGKISVGDIVINSPDKPASASKDGATGEKKESFWDKFWGSKFWFWNWFKADGDTGIRRSGTYNVDEEGQELIVRRPQSGRYTYLETGDGVVPADITSKLFEMGGNPDKQFTDQMSKHSPASDIQTRNINDSVSVGDIYIQNPVGDTDALAKEIVRDLPIKLRQQQGRR